MPPTSASATASAASASKEDHSEGAPACRWLIGGIKVDVMPTSAKVLGFSNQWYPPAVQQAEQRTIGGTTLRVVSGPYFLATKLEAFDGRGQGDYRASHDLEDLIAVVDGRQELVAEVAAAPKPLRHYLGRRLGQLLDEPSFLEALPDHLPGDDASQAAYPSSWSGCVRWREGEDEALSVVQSAAQFACRKGDSGQLLPP